MKGHEFYWRRLHSLLGIIPIGLFLVQHLVVNHFATGGAESFNRAAAFMGNLPFRIVLETVVIYIPLLFHGIYGIYIAFTSRNNPGEYSTFRNWMFIFQRLTGIFLVVFIGWHVFQTRIQAALGTEVDYNMMADILSNPLMIAFYAVGILSATFHFANGLWSFLVSWGITQSPASQRVATYATAILFFALSFVGLQAMIAFL